MVAVGAFMMELKLVHVVILAESPRAHQDVLCPAAENLLRRTHGCRHATEQDL